MTLSERAYRAIRKAISRQILQPGVLYSEAMVAQRLCISRTPIREALARMKAEGLVEVERQQGFSVRSLPLVEVEEFYALRQMLETYVVAALCDSPETVNTRILASIIERQRLATDDGDAFMDCDEEFHVTLARLANLPKTSDFVQSLRGILWLLGTNVTADASTRASIISEHEEVVRAVVLHDQTAARAAISLHLLSTRGRGIAAYTHQKQGLPHAGR